MAAPRFRYFVAAARELHIGRAAEALGIAQPALTQQIQALERETGVRLFRRAGRGIALTDAGAAFLPEAVAALEQEERAVRIARRAARGELGVLNIGYVSTAMLEPALPSLLHLCRRLVPEAQLHLEEALVEAQIAALEQRRLDVAVLRDATAALPPELRPIPLTRSALLAAVPLSLAARLPRPVPLAELAEEGFIALRDPHGIGLAHRVWTLCTQAGFAPRIGLRVDSVTSVIGLVAAGLGVSLVPAGLARLDMPGVELLPLAEEAWSELALVHRPADASPLKLRLLGLVAGEGRAPRYTTPDQGSGT
ncbi:LysR substrate-binding domain-containing protein [Roseomonas sp. OT10]|uniref:LysR substrate-binding domain-containing protein n=1 Tax=Roseomonas cutis TaxID=2897332 RepID=UPI001E57287E|nr:LysR substrate-binding domain-containing protein [Roseomonas sp. OT10]UFN48546.1 LysR substrate-binding domain-containing protein [Roseomonas sp. OT10]